MKAKVVIIGAGPAGLTAGYLLSKNDVDVVVLEADPVYVGGISRTATYKGFHFDIGGHRFFSKSKAVEDLWTEILPNDMLTRPRSSRIFYGGKFFSYPLKPIEALLKLGVFKSILCVLSWLKARLFPIRNPRNFEEWVSNQFGKRLFNTFFKSYTEKVWGMSCKEISADWAAQRIKGLSLGSAIKNALIPQRYNGDRSKVIKTLINSFRYPRRGPGMMWEACAEKMTALGGKLEMGCRVTRCSYDDLSGQWNVEYKNGDGDLQIIEAEHVISSAPMRELVCGLSPAVSERTKRAAESLKYRDFLTVMLILKDREMFDDNWIYIHDPSVKVGRVQNFRSWSPEMVPETDKVCYGLEYFCFEHDGLWDSGDKDLIELAKRELIQIGLAKEGDFVDGCVVRQKKAYPVYDDDYARHVATIRQELDTRYPNLHLVGRNGMHKYNNQDHAMMTAMLCVENILADAKLYDLWQVNSDAEYHEAGPAAAEETNGSALRLVPTRVVSQGDGSLECRVFPGIPGDCRVAPKCFQHQHRHGAFDRRSARCVGFLDLFLPVLPALESCAFASDLRDTPHPREPGSVLPRRRLLGIALSYGAARLHLLEHRGGSHGESVGGYARDGYVRDANCRDCVRCLSSGALGCSNRMARFAQATQMASREPGSCRFDVCGGLRRDRFFRFVPTALGSLGPLHAHAGGWLGHCARLLCSV